jgi:RHS repeat-associated protein
MKHIFKKVLFLLIILAAFSAFSFAEEIQSGQEQNATGLQTEGILPPVDTKSDATIKPEEKPATGIQSVGLQLTSLPEAPSIPETNSRFSPTTAFLSAPGDQIDTSTGALIIKQTDLKLPGKNGLDLEISRTYNSRGFRTSPKWNVFADDKDFIFETDKSVRCFCPVLPKSWGGWVGNGWQMNIFGRLFKNDLDRETLTVSVYESPGRGEYFIPTYRGTVVQIGDINLYFDRYGNPMDKGQHYSLKGTGNGYIVTAKNGIEYHFERMYYYREIAYTEYGMQSEDESERWSTVYYLSSIKDPVGNEIKIEYRLFGPNENASLRPHRNNEQQWDWTLQYWAIRPSKIIDTYGREYTLHYRSNDSNSLEASQIDAISYSDSNGQSQQIQYVYDGNNCLKEVIPPAGNSTKYNYEFMDEHLDDKDYEDKGFILNKMTYPTGAIVNYNYSWFNPVDDIPKMSTDDQKRFSSYRVDSRNLSGSTWNYSYHGSKVFNNYSDNKDEGKVLGFLNAEINNPIGGTTNYQYKEGLVVKETDPAGHISDYTWDYNKKNLMSVKVNKGGSTTMTEYLNYDEYGNPGTVKEYGLLNDPFDDRETHYEYMHQKSGTYRGNHIVDRVSHQWTSRGGEVKDDIYYDYDGSGRGLLETKREAADSGFATTNYSYDRSGNMTSMTDPRGNTTRYGYGQGSPLPTSISLNAGGRTLTLARSYSPHTGVLLTESDYNGNTAGYSYDPIGRVTRKTNPDGTSISYTYNDMNNTIDIRDEKGGETTYVYDNKGRLVEVRQPENLSTKYTYDPLSKITSVRDAGSRSTGYQYDPIGRLTYVTYPDGSGTSLSYQDTQNAVEVTDGNGNATRYKYDGPGNLVEVNEANGGITKYTYDCIGDLLSVKDPRNLMTTYTYTMNGKLSSVKESDGSAATFSYDSVGNLKRKEDGRGNATSFDYDEMNRLTDKRFSDGKFNVRFNYDEPSSANGMGALTSVDDMNGKTIFSYDTMGRLVKKSQPIDGKTYSNEYEYDQAGNIVKVKDPSDSATVYSVDGLGRITQVKHDTKGVIAAVADYRYNPVGTIANISFFNGTKADYAYDRRDRIKTLKVLDPKGTILVQQDLGYDAVGNRISLKSKNEEDVYYEYDNLNRLTKVTYPKDAEEFRYDNAGNRTSLTHAFGKMDYIYDAASNKLTQLKINTLGKVNYSYDGNGNLVKEDHYKGDVLDKTINYKYDPDDRLIEIEKPIQKVSGVDMPDIPSDKADYTYDNGGMRIKKTTRNGTTVYHYDQANQVICETDEKGALKASYVYANNQKIAEVKPDGTIQAFHNDALGSPVLITDKDLKEIQRYIYEPFGNLVVSKGTGKNNYTFTGKERDLESNLFYFGARYYNPILGRFISKDIGRPKYEDPQSINRYLYCLNNPLIYVDPDGKTVWIAFRYIWGYGIHSFIKAAPDNPKAFASYLIPGQNFFTLSAEKGSNGKLTEMLNWSQDYNSEIGKFEVLPPVGQSDTQFISSLLTAFKMYRNDLDYAFSNIDDLKEGDCNTFSKGLLLFAGGRNIPDKLPGWDFGWNQPLDFKAYNLTRQNYVKSWNQWDRASNWFNITFSGFQAPGISIIW